MGTGSFFGFRFFLEPIFFFGVGGIKFQISYSTIRNFTN